MPTYKPPQVERVDRERLKALLAKCSLEMHTLIERIDRGFMAEFGELRFVGRIDGAPWHEFNLDERGPSNRVRAFMLWAFGRDEDMSKVLNMEVQ